MGNITLKEQRAMKELLIVDILRGKHSTGIATVSSTGEVAVVKRAVNAMDFLDFNTANSAIARSPNCIMGHNRHATKGAVNNTNAHPFEFDELVGMHNGTLTHQYKLDDSNDFDVDSENLFYHMDKNGVNDTFEKTEGAFALTWYDKVNNNLCMLRNKERPLSYCFSEDNKTLFWASEQWMLNSILMRCGIKHHPAVVVPINTLYEFEVPKGYMTATYPLNKPSVRLLKKAIPIVKKSQRGLKSGGLKGADSVQYNKMLAYLGETPLFYVERRAKDANGQPYMLCTLDNDFSISVRIYLPDQHALWGIMEQSINSFTARVKAVKNYCGELYLLANIRSLVEVEDDLNTILLEDKDKDNVTKLTVKGFNDDLLTYEQFTKETSEGCCWCTGAAEFGKPTLFLNRFDFVCHKCVGLDDVKDYIMLGGD